MTSYHASLKRKHLQAAMQQTLLEEAEARKAWLRAELASSQSPWLPEEEEEEKVQEEVNEKEEGEEEGKEDEAAGGVTSQPTKMEAGQSQTGTAKRAKWKTKVSNIHYCCFVFVLNL